MAGITYYSLRIRANKLANRKKWVEIGQYLDRKKAIEVLLSYPDYERRLLYIRKVKESPIKKEN